MNRMQTTINRAVLYFGFFLLLYGTTAVSPVYAHKVTIFAWVEGSTVYTESKFAGGKKAKNTPVVVYDKNGTRLLEGKTDENGNFSFTAPEKKEMKVVLLAGMGHQAEWMILKTDFFDEDQLDSGQTKEQDSSQSVQGEGQPGARESIPEAVSSSPCLSQEEIQHLLDKTLEEKLEPLSRSLHRLNNPDHDPTIAEILGGIGYIFGLVGVAGYVHSRRKRA